MIIGHLIYDARSLRTCSQTCYSWYIAAVPHIHRTLIARIGLRNQKLRWPNPLRRMHALGLLPLVRALWVRGDDKYIFPPKRSNWRILRQSSTLTNDRQLAIEHLDIPSFMPRIRWCFGHFLSTVQQLALVEPKGSRRHIIYFIGLFQHLEDLALIYEGVGFREEPADDLTLIPPFVPPLRGSLMMWCLRDVGLLEDMVNLFGGIQFRHMMLFDVDGMQFLLKACAESLETLQLFPIDPRGE